MTPIHRTPQQRDRRFTRVRHLTQLIFIGSGALSAVFVGYAASTAKPVTPTNQSVPATTTAPHPGGAAPTTLYTPPTAAPVTTTTVCTTTPSGTVTCY